MQLVEQYTFWVNDARFEVEEKNRQLEGKALEIAMLSKENEKYNHASSNGKLL